MNSIVRTVLTQGIGLAMTMSVAMASDLKQPANEISTVSFNGLSLAPSTFTIGAGRFTLAMRGQTGAGAMTGIGVFEGTLSERDEASFRELRTAVCSIDPGTLRAPRNDLYLAAILSCPDGSNSDSAFNLIGLGEPGEKINRFVGDLLSSFSRHGEPVAKLDVSATVETRGSKLLVTLMFSNSGREDVTFASPSTWEGIPNPIAGKSYTEVVGAKGTKTDEQFFMQFGGGALVDKSNFTDAVMRVPAGQTRMVRFLTYPDRRFVKGRYAINGGLFIGNVLQPEKLAGRADFTFKQTDVIFAEDFPATTRDLNNFEDHRRQQLFNQIHLIGDVVEESGYYRAYDKSNVRDDFSQILRRGDRFPDRTMEHQQGGSRKSVGPATMWRWEAYPDSKMTALTGECCPRSGYWIPDMPGGLTTTAFHTFKVAGDKRRIMEGDVMPRLGLGDDSGIRWTWLGDIG